MSKYIGSEEKVVKAGEKLNFKNLSKSPVTVGTAVMFNKDGVYICDVLNGRVRITLGVYGEAKVNAETIEKLKELRRSEYDRGYDDGLQARIQAEKDLFPGNGKWERRPDPSGVWDDIPVCSECGCTTKYREETLFCPNCGADMRGGEKNG